MLLRQGAMFVRTSEFVISTERRLLANAQRVMLKVWSNIDTGTFVDHV